MYRFLEEDGLNSTMHSEDDGITSTSKPWGDVIAASILIQLVTFSGLVVVGLGSCWHRLQKKDSSAFWQLVNQVVPSFASGALLATTVFLLIPEALELLEGGHGEEHGEERYLEEEEHEEETSGAAWKFGAALLGGFLFPILLGALFPSPDLSQCDKCHERNAANSGTVSPTEKDVIMQEAEVTDFDTKQPTTTDLNCDNDACPCCDEEDAVAVATQKETKTEKGLAVASQHPRNIPLAASILLGDFCHNFSDGIFLGTAFLLCSKSLAWTLTATTVYHEFAQEIADFFLLTHHCGLTVTQAVVANFCSGFSVLFGAIIVLSFDLTDQSIGAILAVSAGVYIYIAASECIPRIQAARKTVSDTLLFLACFVVGAVPIGLVLLNHGHCEGGDEHDDEH